MAIDARMAALKDEIHNHRHHCLSWHQLRDLEHLVELLAADIAHWLPFFTPASARFAAYLKGSIMAGLTFSNGATVDLVGDVKNSVGVDIPDAVTWNTDQGTISVDPTDPERATLSGVTESTANVTMSTTPDAGGNPIVVTHALVFTDLTPASADFTATAA